MANLFVSHKDFAKAIYSIDQAIEIISEGANFYDSKGEILLMTGDEQGAIALWHKVIELDADFLSKHNGDTELNR